MTDFSLPQDSGNVTKIYYLCDGRDGLPRYVGKTRQTLEKRLREHIWEAKQPRRAHWRKSRWLKKLYREGIKPEIHLIETVYGQTKWIERERYWIAFYKDAGCDLCNLTDGGEGSLNRILSDETKQKISKAHLGKPSPNKGKKMRAEAYENVLAANYKELPKHIMDQLGKVPDRHLAKEACVSQWLIKTRRQERNIPEFEDLSTPNGVNPKTWPQWALDKLGKVEDVVIAKELGVDNALVGQIRKILNIASLRDSFWNQDKIDLLGTKPDYVIADILGVSTMTVNHKRRDLGIDSYKKQRSLKVAS